MRRVLIIDDNAKKAAEELKSYAKVHRLNIHDLMRVVKGQAPPPGNNPKLNMSLVDGWRITYTIEQHPSGWFHHISVSVDPREKTKPMPHEQGVAAILQLFELGSIGDHAQAWVEEAPPRKAINLLFPFSG